jgi:hypothetical protein
MVSPTACSYYGTSVMVSPYSYLLLFWGQCVGFTLQLLLVILGQCDGFTLQLPLVILRPACWFHPTATSCYSGASVMVSPYSYLLLFWGQCVDFTLQLPLVILGQCDGFTLQLLLLFWGQCVDFTLQLPRATAYWVQGAGFILQLHLRSCVLVHTPTPSAMPRTSFVF